MELDDVDLSTPTSVEVFSSRSLNRKHLCLDLQMWMCMYMYAHARANVKKKAKMALLRFAHKLDIVQFTQAYSGAFLHSGPVAHKSRWNIL